MTQKLFLPLSLGYVDHWELEHGIKELIANARDTVENDRERLIFSVTEREDQYYDMCIGNLTDGDKLETKHLVMGVSEHRNSTSSIGQFGEGLKLAMVTILRANRQEKLVIVNHDELWTVSVAANPQMGDVEMPLIEIVPCEPQNRVTFHIEGLTKSEVDNILQMVWDSVTKYSGLEGEDIAIYRDISGLLYVGGIAMGEMQPGFAVNTIPYGIEVNRDRKMPNSLEEVEKRLAKLILNQFDFDEFVATPKEGADEELLKDIERQFALFEDFPASHQIKADFDTGLIDAEETEHRRKMNLAGRWFDYVLLLEYMQAVTKEDDFESMVEKGYCLHENWLKQSVIQKTLPHALCVNTIDLTRARRLARESNNEKQARMFERLATAPVVLKSPKLVYSELHTNLYAVLSDLMGAQQATDTTNSLLADFHNNLV